MKLWYGSIKTDACELWCCFDLVYVRHIPTAYVCTLRLEVNIENNTYWDPIRVLLANLLPLRTSFLIRMFFFILPLHCVHSFRTSGKTKGFSQLLVSAPQMNMASVTMYWCKQQNSSANKLILNLFNALTSRIKPISVFYFFKLKRSVVCVYILSQDQLIYAEHWATRGLICTSHTRMTSFHCHMISVLLLLYF